MRPSPARVSIVLGRAKSGRRCRASADGGLFFRGGGATLAAHSQPSQSNRRKNRKSLLPIPIATSRQPRISRAVKQSTRCSRPWKTYKTMLAVVANNIANAETPGFKRSQAIVEDLGYRQEGMPGVQDPAGAMSSNGFSIGSGSQIGGTEIDFRQGKLKHTGRELDVAIEGRGFFQVKDPSGTVIYCRAGHFSLNASGQARHRIGQDQPLAGARDYPFVGRPRHLDRPGWSRFVSHQGKPPVTSRNDPNGRLR